jgi:hypothetical protein
MKTARVIKPFPFPVYLWTVVFLAVAGLADSLYLAISHYRVYTDINYRSFCAISRAINCDTVSQSRFSIFFDVPVPIWGVIGYTFFLLFLPNMPKPRINSGSGFPASGFRADFAKKHTQGSAYVGGRIGEI